MKRVCVAGAVALALAGCGGGKAQFTIGGTIDGLVYDGLVLTANGQSVSVPAKATAFAMPKQIAYGDMYEITVATSPAHQDCVVYAGKDSAGHTVSISAFVQCAVQTHQLGGSITGLKGTGLVLINGSLGGGTGPAANAGNYFLPPVTYGESYGVTVLTQPKDQTCTVLNGTGVMGDTDVLNVNVTCVDNP